MVFHRPVAQLGFGSDGTPSCTNHRSDEPKNLLENPHIQPSTCTHGGIIHSAALSPSSSQYKMPPITVLHIRMPPRLSQRTKQPYAKQSGIPTYIVMRRNSVRKRGRGAGAVRGVKHDGGRKYRKVGGAGGPQGSLLALKRGTCGDTTPTA